MSYNYNDIVKAIQDAKNDSHKKPTLQVKHVGIEVELVSPVSKDTLRTVFALAGLKKYVNVGDDSSIEPDDEYDDEIGAECRILCKESEVSTVLPKFFELIKNLRCYVNDSCGLHVHIDARNRDPHQMFENFYSAQELLYSCISKGRRDNDYCNPVFDYNYNSYKKNKRFNAMDKYHGINLSAYTSHKTVELRMHHATMEAATVMSWVKLLIQVADLKKSMPSWELLKSKYLSAETKTFIRGRINQYGKYNLKDDDRYDEYEEDDSVAW